MSFKTEVEINALCAPNETVDALAQRVPEAAERWKTMLERAKEEKPDLLEYCAPRISKLNSKNFQVIGMLYKVLQSFGRDNEYPRVFRIVCPDAENATMYKQVYNFYIPRTKDERMNDGAWD